MAAHTLVGKKLVGVRKEYTMANEFDFNATAQQDAAGAVFDLSAVEDSVAFEVLPKGTYEAVIEDMEFTTSKTSGAPMLHACYSIVGGEYEGRKVHDYYLLTGNGAEYSLPRLKQLISRVCPEVAMNAFNPQQFADSGVAINRMCQIKLAVTTQKKGEYKGEKRNNIREILASSDVANSFLG